MQSTQKLLPGDDLQTLIEQLEPGSSIILHEGRFEVWHACEGGVVVQLGDKLLLNGEILVYQQPGLHYWRLEHNGLISQVGSTVFFNGRVSYIHKGSWIRERRRPRGRVIQGRRGELLLDGKTLLYDGFWHCWEEQLYGVVVQLGDRLSLYPFPKR